MERVMILMKDLGIGEVIDCKVEWGLMSVLS